VLNSEPGGKQPAASRKEKSKPQTQQGAVDERSGREMRRLAWTDRTASWVSELLKLRAGNSDTAAQAPQSNDAAGSRRHEWRANAALCAFAVCAAASASFAAGCGGLCCCGSWSRQAMAAAELQPADTGASIHAHAARTPLPLPRLWRLPPLASALCCALLCRLLWCKWQLPAMQSRA
jgi:hypothetical protein